MRPPVPHTTTKPTPSNHKANKHNKSSGHTTKTITKTRLLKSRILPTTVVSERTICDKLSKRVSRGGGGGGGGAVPAVAAADAAAADEGEVKSSSTDTIAPTAPTTSNEDVAMAPAVTEPLSPAEKLVKSSSASSVTPTVSATPPPTTPTTRSTSRHNKTTDKADILLLATTSAASGTAATSKENKRNRTVSATSVSTTPTSTTTRVTRSKDAAYQRVFEQAVAPLSSPSPTSVASPTPTPNTQQNKEAAQKNNNNNEQMGLSATINNNNSSNSSSNKDEANSSGASVAAAAAESCNSTEQLLADLTNDFEEAITAEICLRKQLLDVDLGKSGGEGNGSVTTIADAASKSPKNALVAKTTKLAGDKSTEALFTQSSVDIESKAAPTTEQTTETAEVETTTSQKLDVAGANATRAQIISVEELPPISTDSTMTASEVEDNLEERLSQLDGSAVVPLTSDEVAAAVASSSHMDESLNITIVPQQQQQQQLAQSLLLSPATPPHRTPQQQHQQQQFAQIQQLQLLSPTPTMGVAGMVQNTTTPQSITSANSSLVACGGSGSAVGDELQDGELEEVLKALKTFDANTAGDGLGDFNSIFSDIVYSSLSYDDVSSQQATAVPGGGGGGASSSTASAATTSARATRSPPPSPPRSPPQSPTSPLKEVQAEIERQQQLMQRKIDFLVRRMRKVQARNMCRHTSEEVAGLFEWSARIANKRGGVATSGAGDMAAPQTPLQSTPQLPIIAARPPAHNWADAQKSPVPSAQMSAVLRKLEASANAQQLCTTPSAAYAAPSSSAAGAGYTQLKRSKKALAAQEAAAAAAALASSSTTWPGATPSGSNTRRGGAVVVPTFDSNVAEEITHVAGLLQSEMREVQNAIDSDATESSSGGESADEMVTYNNQLQQSLSIAKRAAWRYSRDRAAIASRWSWLLSQIADLEIKIRQHSELHQELVRTKGAVITCTTDAVKSADAPSTSSNGVNGYKGDLLRNANTEEASLVDVEEGSCRTRGFIISQFRKRKLLQTMNIHNISKKASRPSNIKCGCQWPTLPCGLCTGRLDPTSPRDLPDTMMTPDRVALLDGCYHPVLSFPEDVSNSIHFEAVARLPDFQQRIMRCQVKSIAKSVWRAEREAAAAAAGRNSTSKRHSGGGGGNESTTKRRYIKKKDRIAAEEKAAAAAAAASASSSSAMPHDGVFGSSTTAAGNGTGASTTPLVANKSMKNSSRKMHQQQQHSHLVAGDGVLMEPLSPAATNHSSSQHSQSSSHHSYIHQTSETPLQNQHHFEQFNPNPIHSSLISNNNNSTSYSKSSKHRKLSAASATNYHNSNNHYHNYQQQQQHYNSQYYQQQQSSSNGNGGDSHFLHTNDNWDSFTTRSRTSSPTHGGNSNYHKYERSLDRKNRTSYDIDNIVIPYSVAAATRVEILPYKEIPTPKWRVIEDDNEESNSDDSSSNPNKTAEAAEMAKEFSSNVLGATEATANNIAESVAAAVAATGATAPDAAAVAPAAKLTTTEIAAEEFAKSNGIETKDAVESSESKTDKQTKKSSPAVDKDKLNNVSKSAAAAEEEQSSDCEKKKEKATHVEYVTNEMQDPSGSVPAAILENAKADEVKPNAVATAEIKASTAAAAVTSSTSSAAAAAAADTGVPRKSVANVVNHTPSWSIAEEKQRAANDSYDSADVDGGAEEDEEEEDISDEATILRHERALTEERRKFQTYLKFPWSTRSRANRRIDSRAESSGANTPDPASPAPNTPSVGGGDQESIPSPLAPSTPLNPLDSISEAGENISGNANPLAAPQSTAATSANIFNCINNKRFERRRTTSTKKERETTTERRSSTPDLKELIPPYEPLQFPLPDEVFNSLLQVMPSEYHQDDSKYSEDCYTSITSTPFTFTNSKAARHPHPPTPVRNNFRNNTATPASKQQLQRSNSKSALAASAAAATTNNGDGASNKNRKKTISSSSRGSGGHGGVATTSDAVLQYEENGKEDMDTAANDVEEDDQDNDDDEEDEEDYYPKHHLAPDDSIYDNCGAGVGGGGGDGDGATCAEEDAKTIARMRIDEEYGAYVGRRVRNMLDDSDGESSETEPFQDDDPNDPEWKGESEERSERVRKKF